MAESDDFFVRFWGVRGSIPCPGAATARYGGNTSCLEIRCADHILIFDSGTGIHELGQVLEREAPVRADLFLSHTHYDHVWGWPHFAPALDRRNAFTIWAGHLMPDRSIEELMMGLLDDPLNPLNRKTLQASLSFRDFEIGHTLEPQPDVRIRTAPLNHPNGSSGYRIEYNGRSICYVTDTEHKPDRLDENVLALIEGADIVIYDSTYTDEEFPKHVTWGHSTWQEGVRLCDAASARNFVVFHHDPGHDDSFMDQIAADVAAERLGSVVAREGLVLRPRSGASD